jgi:hypothetical protein
MEKIKSKSELLQDMQRIAKDVENKKKEIEVLLKVIDNLEKEYYEIAEQIQKN